MTEAALTPEDRDLLAAELALGVLEGEERTRALRLQLADAGFRAAVVDWEHHFAQLLDAIPEATPPDLWAAIAARLPTHDLPNVTHLGRRLHAWRIGAFVSGGVAAVLALMLLIRPAGEQLTPAPTQIAAAPAVVAQLGTGEGAAQLVANYDPDSAQLRIRALRLPQSKLAPELWIIPQGGAPRSLGLLTPQGTNDVTVDQQLRPLLRDGATLAVTLEPRAGAPHDAPSSTPIAAGTLHEI